MMKVYHKKSTPLEDETALVHLERRHTVIEDTNGTDSDLRKAIRANSLGSFGEGPSSRDETVAAENQNSFTRKPTIITESELVASRIYKDIKAKINSDDESIEDPIPTAPCENDEDLEPGTLQDPALRPVPVSNQRPRKTSSCCWYFTIILVICIACLAVMAGVGGIVYMEYFATYKDKDISNNDTSGKSNNPSASKETFQHPTRTHVNLNQNEPIIPEQILKDLIKNITMRVEGTSQPRHDILHNKDLMDSNDGKAKKLNIKSSSASKNQITGMTEFPEIELSDISQYIISQLKNFNSSVSDKSEEMKSNDKTQDTPDFKVLHKNTDTVVHLPENHFLKVDDSIFTETSNSETEASDANEETLRSRRNFNFDEITTLQSIELKSERVNGDISFQNLPKQNPIEHSDRLPSDNSFDHKIQSIEHESKDNSLDHIEHSIDRDSEDGSLDHTEQSIDHESEDGSLDHARHSIDHESEDSLDHTDHSIDNESEDSLDHTGHSIDHESEDSSLDNIEPFIDHSPKNNSLDQTELSIDSNAKSLNDHSEDSNDRSTNENSLVDDSNKISDDSAQLVFLQPVVESKAIPIPLAFLRSIGFDIKNPSSHQPMTAKDMDIKFSLAEALKYLRSLDTDRKLPVSREKTFTRKLSNQESKTTKLPIASEREEYLNRLRRQFFEKSL